ncbi:MAG: DUF5320 domain-containing protein [Marinilabiliales bacterium]|nr:DUF5320 domain-containing protein [Marinilabiliales bacterium]
MPQLNQTGPEGQGAMTGRKAGRCTSIGAGKVKEETSGGSNNDDNTGGAGGERCRPGPGPW